MRCSGGETHLSFSVVYFSGLSDEPTQLGRPAIKHAALGFHVFALGMIVVAAGDRGQRLALGILGRLMVEARCNFGIREPFAGDSCRRAPQVVRREGLPM